jgi:TRAP-type C4-dicarboxylate transport system substrate-binding protein
MNFIREKETKYILDTYKSMTPQNLLDYLMQHNNDSDCIYIFNNLPKDLQKIVDDLAGEVVKANAVKIKANAVKIIEMDEKIKANAVKIKANAVKIKNVDQQILQADILIQSVTRYNKQLDKDIYNLEHQLETTRALNGQLGIF